jgi:surface antigen
MMAGAIVPRPADAVPLVLRPAAFVTVETGDTAASVATHYHVDEGTLRWANGWLDGTQPDAGSQALIPPSNGVLVPVFDSERPSALATRLHLDPQLLLEFNHLTRDDPRPGGTYLQVPADAVSGGVIQAANVVPVGDNVPGVSAKFGTVGDTFPYGQCTWYVAKHRGVTWGGDAWRWWANARGIRPEGHIPIANSIVVFDTGWAGHVGIVQHVNADGSYTISEMNYYGNGGGWGRVDQRTIGASDRTVLGFIY